MWWEYLDACIVEIQICTWNPCVMDRYSVLDIIIHIRPGCLEDWMQVRPKCLEGRIQRAWIAKRDDGCLASTCRLGMQQWASVLMILQDPES